MHFPSLQGHLRCTLALPKSCVYSHYTTQADLLPPLGALCSSQKCILHNFPINNNLTSTHCISFDHEGSNEECLLRRLTTNPTPQTLRSMGLILILTLTYKNSIPYLPLAKRMPRAYPLHGNTGKSGGRVNSILGEYHFELCAWVV